MSHQFLYLFQRISLLSPFPGPGTAPIDNPFQNKICGSQLIQFLKIHVPKIRPQKLRQFLFHSLILPRPSASPRAPPTPAGSEPAVPAPPSPTTPLISSFIRANSGTSQPESSNTQRGFINPRRPEYPRRAKRV